MNAWSLVVFCITVVAVLVLVIVEPVLPLPIPASVWALQHKGAAGSSTPRKKVFKLPISYGWAPVVGVLVLLAAGAASGTTIRNGIVGDDRVKPYSILIIFMTQAYLCVSLDHTGIFAWTAAQVTRYAGSKGKQVFLAYFLLASVLTVLTSNDVVILTLTPIIYYYSQATGSDPEPLLYLEFFVANIWSMALVIGNPTNVIVAQATQLSFINFSKWMLLPTIATGMVSYALLRLYFRRRIPDTIATDVDMDPASLLVDPLAALLGSGVLLLCLVMLTVANFIHAPLWTITLGAAALLLVVNLALRFCTLQLRQVRSHERIRMRVVHRETGRNAADAGSQRGPGTVATAVPTDVSPGEVQMVLRPAEIEEAAHQNGHAEHGWLNCSVHKMSPSRSASGQTMPRLRSSEPLPRSSNTGTPPHASGAAVQHVAVSIDSAARERQNGRLEHGNGDHRPGGDSQPTAQGQGEAAADEVGQQPQEVFHLRRSLMELPWHVVPFLLGMFIIVEALDEAGWVDFFARVLGKGINSNFAALFLTGAVASVLANIINNQPMTILVARMLLSPELHSTAPRIQAANLALVAASNVGSNLTLLGSLAGVMWVKLLQQKGMKVGYLYFFKIAVVTMTPLIGVCLLALFAETFFIE